MARSNTMRVPVPVGGEASIFPLVSMPPKFASRLQNMHVSQTGGIAKIPGYLKANTVSVGSTLTSGFEFRKSDGTVIILAAGGGSIYRLDGGTLSAIKTGLNTSAKVSFTAINDNCIMVNGVDAPMKYDGTTVSNLGGTPPGTALKAHVHKGRIWMIERSNKLMASHSSLNNPEDYTTANNAGYIDFKFILKEGDELLDIVTYVDLLIFFFRNHIAVYSGSNPTSMGDFRLVQLIKGVGLASTGVVLDLGTDCIFLSQSGVKSLQQIVTTGALNIANISKYIDPTLQVEMNSGISACAMVHYPAKSWGVLLLNDKVWIYSYLWKAWGRMVGADVKGMFGTADGKVYLCGTGFLYTYGQGWTFAGVEPDCLWEGAWLTPSKNGNRVYPKILEILNRPAERTTIGLRIRFDFSDKSYPEHYTSLESKVMDGIADVNAVSDWDAVGQIDFTSDMPARVPLFGGGRNIQLAFSNKSDVCFELNDLLMQVTVGN